MLGSLIKELQDRADKGVLDIKRKWFLRACKRHDVGYHDATKILLTLQILEPKSDKCWHPVKNGLKPLEWHTYREWQHKGWQVLSGESATHKVGKNGFKRPMFSNKQVKWVIYEET